MNMYKMILSDLDETLLVDHHVPLINRRAVKSLENKGVQFVLATGRSFPMVKDVLEELDLEQKENEYTICFNGGLIIENKDARILQFQGLTFAETEELVTIGGAYDVCIMIFTLDCCYMIHANEDEIARKTAQKSPFQIIDDIECLRDEKIAKVLFQRCDMAYLQTIEEEIVPQLHHRFAMSYSSHRYLEFNPEGVSKGEALIWLAHKLGIEISQTIAIGDNYNDTSMIEVAGLGVCVANAIEDIKELADYVTTQPYDQGAVAEVIDTFIGGNKNV